MKFKFCELLSIKEPQTTLQKKETTVQSYGSFLDVRGEMRKDKFRCLNS